MIEYKGGSLESVKQEFLKNPFEIEGEEPIGENVGKSLMSCFTKQPIPITTDFVLKFGFQLKLAGINWRHQDQIGIIIEWMRVHGLVRVFIDKEQDKIFVSST